MVDGRVVLRDGERHERALELGGALHAHGLDDVAEPGAVVRRQTPHDPQVDVNDFPVADEEVARMRVGMEEAVVEDLRGVVVEDLLADLLQVVAGSPQPVGRQDGDAVDVLHDQHVLATEFRVHVRAVDERHVLVQPRELLEVRRLALEVRLLEERGPQLLHHVAQVEHLVVLHEARRLARHHAHDVDVERHGGLHAGTLDLHRHDVAVREARLVHLCKRRAAERRGIYGVEDVALAFAVDVVEGREHLVERQRVALHLQLLQLVAVGFRQDLRARGQRLADLHEAGAQVLQHGAKLLRREAAQEMVLLQDGVDLLQPARARLAAEIEPPLGVDLRA